MSEQFTSEQLESNFRAISEQWPSSAFDYIHSYCCCYWQLSRFWVFQQFQEVPTVSWRWRHFLELGWFSFLLIFFYLSGGVWWPSSAESFAISGRWPTAGGCPRCDAEGFFSDSCQPSDSSDTSPSTGDKNPPEFRKKIGQKLVKNWSKIGQKL